VEANKRTKSTAKSRVSPHNYLCSCIISCCDTVGIADVKKTYGRVARTGRKAVTRPGRVHSCTTHDNRQTMVSPKTPDNAVVRMTHESLMSVQKLLQICLKAILLYV